MDVLNFAIGLEDRVSPNAKKGKSALDELTSSLDDAKGKLAAYQAQLSRANDLGDIAGHAKYSALVDSTKRSVFDLTQQLEAVPAGASGASSALAGIPGPLMAIAAGVTATIGGLVALGSVVGGLIEKAFEVTGANEKLAASFDALGDTRGGKNTLDLVKQLSKELPQSKAQIVEWTKQLQATGVTDIGELRAQLKATASAQAIMGDSGAAAYEKLREKVNIAVESHTPLKIATKGLTALYKSGLNAEDIASRMGKTTNELATGLKAGTIDAVAFGDAMRDSLLVKGKRPLEAANNSLDVLIGKIKGAWKGAWSSLFSDVDTKPLISGLQTLAWLGGDTAKNASVLKGGFTGALNAIISLLGRAIVEATIFFMDVEIFALDAYIAMKPLIRGFERIVELGGKAADFVAPAFGGPAKNPNSALGEAPTGVERAQSFANTGTALAVGNAFSGGVLGGMAALPVLAYDMISSIGGDAGRAAAHAGGVEIGKATIEGIREGTDTHSPSPLVIGIGRSIGLSLGMGMTASPEPARAARTVSGYAIGGLAKGAANANGGHGAGGGAVVHIGRVEIMAPEGVTDATQLTAISLSTVLERYAFAGGR